MVISEREDLTDTAMDNFSPQARWLQHKKNWSIVPSEIREKREKSATFLLVRKCARWKGATFEMSESQFFKTFFGGGGDTRRHSYIADIRCI